MLRDLLNWGPKRELVELVVPRKTFADVILPEKTRRALADTLVQIEKHYLIFEAWGLGERHSSGTGLVFNFTGPPGTGKTICAEAVANLLGKRLYKVRYSEMESCWAGETGKNIVTVFREARQQDAVLFFDEADSVASRRFTTTGLGYEREANQAVNILLKELEFYEGVVIFATNLWTNFDPAFERRVRTHIIFEMPGPRERELIWKVQIHPQKTPLASDVDFRALAEKYAVSGGDIKNAVLKAAQMAAGEQGSDSQKRIHQRHFVRAMEEVLESKKVMTEQAPDQSPDTNLEAAQQMLLGALQTLETRVGTLERDGKRQLSQIDAVRKEFGAATEAVGGRVDALQQELSDARQAIEERIVALSTEWNNRTARVTLLPVPKWVATAILVALGLGAAVGGGFVATHLH